HHQVVDDGLGVAEVGLALARQRVLDHAESDQRLIRELLDEQREAAARQGLVLGRARPRRRFGAWLVHASDSIGTRSGLPAREREPRAAATKPRKIGCGFRGELLNSGWNCTPTKKGWPWSSMISTTSSSGWIPLGTNPAARKRSR